MTHRTIKTLLWITTGLLLCMAIAFIVLSGLSGQILVTDTDRIPQTTDAILTSIQTSDWDRLSKLTDGKPDLAPLIGEEGTPEHLIWTAYQNSLQWHCQDEYTLQGTHIHQNITVTALDIPALTKRMTEILPKITVSAINITREQALLEAAEQVLSTDIPLADRKITLVFTRKGGQWKLVPDNALLALLSGFTAP